MSHVRTDFSDTKSHSWWGLILITLAKGTGMSVGFLLLPLLVGAEYLDGFMGTQRQNSLQQDIIVFLAVAGFLLSYPFVTFRAVKYYRKHDLIKRTRKYRFVLLVPFTLIFIFIIVMIPSWMRNHQQEQTSTQNAICNSRYLKYSEKVGYEDYQARTRATTPIFTEFDQRCRAERWSLSEFNEQYKVYQRKIERIEEDLANTN